MSCVQRLLTEDRVVRLTYREGDSAAQEGDSAAQADVQKDHECRDIGEYKQRLEMGCLHWGSQCLWMVAGGGHVST